LNSSAHQHPRREAIAEEGRRLLGVAAGAAGHNIRISSLN
jgi:hypothetical protein